MRLLAAAKQRLLRRFEQSAKTGRTYIIPTTSGVVYYAMVLAMVWGSTNYNVNLGFGVAFLLAGMGLVSMIHTSRNARQVVGVEAVAGPVFAGDTARAVLTVSVKGRAYALRFSLGAEPSPQTDIPAPWGAVQGVRVPPATRGRRPFGAVVMVSGHPFGLFRSWRRLPAAGTRLVYPRPLAGPPVHSLGEGVDGDSVEGPGSEDFHGIRPYQPGDSLTRIAWKASSRGVGLMVKQFQGGLGRSRIFDFESLDGDEEHRLSRLAGMLLEAHERGEGFGLALPGLVLEPAADRAHLDRCLEALALFGQTGDAP